MSSSVQHRFESALAYFEYGSEPQSHQIELPEQILGNHTLEQPQSRLQDHIITKSVSKNSTSRPSSIWQRVAALGMSYLLCTNGQQSTLPNALGFTRLVAVMDFTALGAGSHPLEAWALPLTFIAGLSTFPDVTYAQSSGTTFFDSFGGAGDDRGYALTATPEGDLIVAGETYSFGEGLNDVLLAKIARNGTLLWANSLGGEDNDGGYALIVTSEGDLIVSGYTESFGAGADDLLVAKFSNNGTLLWTSTLGGVDDDRGYALTATLEGDLIFTGYAESDSAGNYDVLLGKFASNGTLIWSHTLGGPGDDWGSALTTTPEGDLVVTGFTRSFGAGNDDVLLAKFASNGTFLWANALGGPGDDRGSALTTTPEGDLVVTGFTKSFGAGIDDVLLAKFASNGTLLWTNTLGKTSSDFGQALTTTSEGEIFVTGRFSNFGAVDFDVLLAKYASNGTLLRANRLGIYGGDHADQGQALISTPEGSLFITGYTQSFGAGSYDVLLAKVGAQGDIENCSAWQSIAPQVQSITPIITDITQNMTVGTPPWTVQNATSVLNVMDITNLLNQTTECFAQIGDNQISTTSPETPSFPTNKTPSALTQASRASFASSISSSISSMQTRSSLLTPTLSSTSRGNATPSITTFIYEESYPIIVNGETIGTFSFTGGTGQLDSDNTNTLYIQLYQDLILEEGVTVVLFTVSEGEESLWEDIVLSYESESGCVTSEGVFTTSEEGDEHSYQMIFEFDSECSQYTAALKLSAVSLVGLL